ncbi:hypothetical protein TNCV_1050421 [Trichonephila clavipes]|nr:hypothetical protein TNCV_1050421 [Trichonephila clavipes]
MTNTFLDSHLPKDHLPRKGTHHHPHCKGHYALNLTPTIHPIHDHTGNHNLIIHNSIIFGRDHRLGDSLPIRLSVETSHQHPTRQQRVPQPPDQNRRSSRNHLPAHVSSRSGSQPPSDKGPNHSYHLAEGYPITMNLPQGT